MILSKEEEKLLDKTTVNFTISQFLHIGWWQLINSKKLIKFLELLKSGINAYSAYNEAKK